MKKLLCLLAVLSFIMLTALNADAQMTIGGRVGLDIGSLSYSPGLPSGNSTSYHTGFLVGVQMDDWLNDMWAISVQLLYDQKGSFINVNDIAKNNAYNTSASGASETVNSRDIRLAAGILFQLD